jgi:hypothetical protein
MFTENSNSVPNAKESIWVMSATLTRLRPTTGERRVGRPMRTVENVNHARVDRYCLFFLITLNFFPVSWLRCLKASKLFQKSRYFRLSRFNFFFFNLAPFLSNFLKFGPNFVKIDSIFFFQNSRHFAQYCPSSFKFGAIFVEIN